MEDGTAPSLMSTSVPNSMPNFDPSTFEYDSWLAPLWQPAPMTLPLHSTHIPQQMLLMGSAHTSMPQIAAHPGASLQSDTNFMSKKSHKSLTLSEVMHRSVNKKETLDGNSSNLPYKLVVTRQPEEQHRARYLSEGSRGAIKDRSGSSHCTIQLAGFYRPTRVELFAASGSGEIVPHPYYRLIPVSGKSANATPCEKMAAADGIECLEITLRPENGMTAILDCMGLLKICSYDAKQRRIVRNAAGSSSSTRKSTLSLDAQNFSANALQNSVRIVIRAYIPIENVIGGEMLPTYNVLQVETEPIRCVQQLGVPEVLKMSLGSAIAKGGAELFIIGRNFDRNTKVVFREYKEDGTLGWSADATMDKTYLHQCHIVCTVPPYHSLYRSGNVSVTVVCGNKSSHPRTFRYNPCVREDEEDDWRPPGSPQEAMAELYDPYGNRDRRRSYHKMSLADKQSESAPVSYCPSGMPFFDYDDGPAQQPRPFAPRCPSPSQEPTFSSPNSTSGSSTKSRSQELCEYEPARKRDKREPSNDGQYAMFP
ncbi:rel homology dimerization domain-containing protein [Ditylenchus destructor]|nr:rel homology dimerization domain-containing protein [Ditylenchus destructor]